MQLGTEKLLRTAQSRDSQAPQEKKRKKEGRMGRGREEKVCYNEGHNTVANV